MAKVSTLFYGCIIALCSALLCSCTRQYEDEYPVEVSDAQFKDYFNLFQKRLQVWQSKLGLEEIRVIHEDRFRASTLFFEFHSTSESTCYFDEPNRILIGDTKWNSGCVPHEIGHAYLYFIGHPCWGEFEHVQEEEKCKRRLQ